jgi:hypothetical protein
MGIFDPQRDKSSNSWEMSYDFNWKTIIKWTYYAFILLSLLVSLASSYIHGVAFRNGSMTPTTTQTESLSSDDNQVVYVTRNEKKFVLALQAGSLIGMLSVFVSGLLLENVFGILVFGTRKNPTKDKEWTIWDDLDKPGKD